MQESRTDIEIQSVTELIFLRRLIGFNARCEMDRLVTSKAAAAERSQKMTQQPEAEKVDGFVRQFESRTARRRFLLPCPPSFKADGSGLLLRLNPSFFDHAPDQLVDQIVQFLGVAFRTVRHPLLQEAFGNASHFDQLLEDCLPERIEIMRVAHFAKAVRKPL